MIELLGSQTKGIVLVGLTDLKFGSFQVGAHEMGSLELGEVEAGLLELGDAEVGLLELGADSRPRRSGPPDSS